MTESLTADPVAVARRGDGIVEIVLNRPHRANAIDLALARCLRSVVTEVLADPSTAALVLTGSGPRFCCGGDIVSFSEVPDLPEHLRAVTDELHAALAQLHRAPVPVVSAVRGDAAGAGIGLALAADVVVASNSARFTFGFTKLGLSPDASTSWGLVRRVGLSRATRFALTNRTVPAADAEACGLADEVVAEDELASVARRRAQEMAGQPRAAVSATRDLLQSASGFGVVAQMSREQESLVRLASDMGPAQLAARFSGRQTRAVEPR